MPIASKTQEKFHARSLKIPVIKQKDGFDHPRDQAGQSAAILAVWGCTVPVGAYNTPMGHTQPAQNNNNRPCSLVRAEIYHFFMCGFMRG
jgi:hypothetical protein